MNSIIIYYSRSGNTARLAQRLSSDLGDIPTIKIEPEKSYGNYIMACLRVMRETVAKVTPKFVTPIPDLSGYDTVFVGFPMWMQDVPELVQEFIRRCDLGGKTVIPFATYGASGIGWAKKTLAALFADAQLKLPFDSGVFKKGDYDKWLSELKKL